MKGVLNIQQIFNQNEIGDWGVILIEGFGHIGLKFIGPNCLRTFVFLRKFGFETPNSN